MDWTSLVILAAAVWLAIYVLMSLVAEHRRELLDQWQKRRGEQRAQQKSEQHADDQTPTSDPPQAAPT